MIPSAIPNSLERLERGELDVLDLLLADVRPELLEDRGDTLSGDGGVVSLGALPAREGEVGLGLLNESTTDEAVGGLDGLLEREELLDEGSNGLGGDALLGGGVGEGDDGGGEGLLVVGAGKGDGVDGGGSVKLGGESAGGGLGEEGVELLLGLPDDHESVLVLDGDVGALVLGDNTIDTSELGVDESIDLSGAGGVGSGLDPDGFEDVGHGD